MTDKIMEARRKSFELFVISQGLDCEFDDMRNCYSVFACHFAWQAYNAALDSLCVNLPFETYGCMEASAVIEAIHAAGVKTR